MADDASQSRQFARRMEKQLAALESAVAGLGVSPGVAARRPVSPGVRPEKNRPNEANFLRNATAGVAEGLVQRAIGNAPLAVSAAVPVDKNSRDATRPGSVRERLSAEPGVVDPRLLGIHQANAHSSVSRDVAACRPVSPDVRCEKRPNEANLPGGKLSPPGVKLSLRASVDGGLTEQQLAAIRLLLDGVKPTQVAAELHIATRTLLRWRKSGPFIAELKRQYERWCGSK